MTLDLMINIRRTDTEEEEEKKDRLESISKFQNECCHKTLSGNMPRQFDVKNLKLKCEQNNISDHKCKQQLETTEETSVSISVFRVVCRTALMNHK